MPPLDFSSDQYRPTLKRKPTPVRPTWGWMKARIVGPRWTNDPWRRIASRRHGLHRLRYAGGWGNSGLGGDAVKWLSCVNKETIGAKNAEVGSPVTLTVCVRASMPMNLSS